MRDGKSSRSKWPSRRLGKLGERWTRSPPFLMPRTSTSSSPPRRRATLGEVVGVTSHDQPVVQLVDGRRVAFSVLTSLPEAEK